MPVSDKKREYGTRLVELLESSRSIIFVGADNVGSKQIQDVRMALRGEGTMLMGKNTTIRRIIQDYLDRKPSAPFGALLEHVVGNIGFIFTNGDVAKLRDTVQSYRVPAPARVGAAAPDDVFIEPGPTGCDPGQTAWFQALHIPTKINKGQIEMISRVHLVKKGERVNDSSAALLQKLNIKPFSYSLIVTKVYENGDVFDAAVLDITESSMIEKLMRAAGFVAAISLELGIPTLASVTHSVNNAYKAVLSIGLGTSYKFPGVTKFEEFFADPSKFIVAAPVAAGAVAAAPAAAVEEEEEEEEESVEGAGGLFGDSDSDS